ncbi:MAG: pirin family protein [Proteobacteria bacterium]|nr:pirin family protein [Pseudomonadota bacterium]
MLTLRKADERGKTRIDWLDSKHTFSFGEYHHPQHMGFGPLRVINEDRVAPGGGFQPHPHRDMEIITYPLEGALAHKDSLGSGSVIRPGEIQRMSAGTGIVHSEFNASNSEPVHFLQIWIVPSEKNLDPSYEQKAIDTEAVRNKFARVASSEPLPNEVRLVQDAEIWVARFEGEEEAVHKLQPGRKVWLHVARGNVEVLGQKLSAGDAAAIVDEEDILVRAREPAEVLLFDVA